MHTPAFVVGPGGTAPPEIEEADLLAAIIGDDPVLILLPRFKITQVDQTGRLLTGDAFEAAMHANGARRLSTLDFRAGPIPGWLVAIDAVAGRVQITGPGTVGTVYDGELVFQDLWHQRVVAAASHQGLVLITGSSAATPEAALDMIAAGRASWVRAAVELVEASEDGRSSGQ
ncbi:hypothetical protein [Nocardia farcinica]|uniref:hypothetical protein n=1 Tax=Nocardia farcinica TaxID=37329 RepID=UPI0024589D9C|nr:hypothetical protein [Nocardia farcinica]